MVARKKTKRHPADADGRTLAAGFEKVTLAIDGVRAEMRAGFGELRGEIADLRGELRGEIADLRQEMRAELAEVRGDLGLVKVAVLEHSRALKEVRTALDRKVDRPADPL
jgi:hypothetical protein